jgi:hypothetical protein
MRSTLLVFVLALAAAGCAATTRDVEVVRHDVGLSLFADGSIEVLESISARSLDPQARFVHSVPGAHVDRIADIKSTLDNAPGGEVLVDRSRGMHATWSFTGAPAGHVMTLQYRVTGALAAQEIRGLLRWKALPAGRSYPVGASRINIRVADGGHFIAGPSIEGSPVQFAVQGVQASAELTPVQPNEAVVISADVEFGSAGMPEPAWQTNAARAWRLMPAFLSAGICLIAIAFGIIAMMRIQYKPASRTASGAGIDAEWAGVLRGLRISGVVALIIAVIGALVIDRTLARFGIWPMAIPAGVLGMGVIFLWTSLRWRRATNQ